jgi:hypothetical protein
LSLRPFGNDIFKRGADNIFLSTSSHKIIRINVKIIVFACVKDLTAIGRADTLMDILTLLPLNITISPSHDEHMR